METSLVSHRALLDGQSLRKTGLSAESLPGWSRAGLEPVCGLLRTVGLQQRKRGYGLAKACNAPPVPYGATPVTVQAAVAVSPDGG